VVRFHRSGWYYCSRARDISVIRKRMQEIAQVLVRYGFWRSLFCSDGKAGEITTSGFTASIRRRG
jgi:hypothetical protein